MEIEINHIVCDDVTDTFSYLQVNSHAGTDAHL